MKLLLLYFISSVALANSLCDNSLKICLDISAEQDAYIIKLKADEQELLKKVESQPLLPGWAWCLIGGAVGVTLKGLIK